VSGTTRWAEPVMGTVVSIHTRTPVPVAALRPALRYLHEVDARFSPYLADSEVSRVVAGTLTPAQASAELRLVSRLSERMRAFTGGYFDAYYGGSFDPSGLVKGWATQRASLLLRRSGLGAHYVNVGGDIQTYGGPWRIGIANPADSATLVAVVEVTGLAVATSGTRERGAHVLDPYTGRASGDLVAVTVVGPSLTRADCYATAALAMGAGARGWLSGLRGYSALTIDHCGQVWRGPGFPG